MMFDKEQWLEDGAMEMDLDGYESIRISTIEVDLLLPEARETIKEQAMLHDTYRELCKQVSKEGNIDMNFSITDELVC
jgi:hypothetical protein